MEQSNLDYYKSLSDRFDMFDDNTESPAPGQIILNKETNARWTPLTCKQNNIDFQKFVDGQLEARKAEQE